MLTYRATTASDWPFVRAAHHEALRDVIVRTWGPWDEAVQDRFTRQEFDTGTVEIILEAGVPVGYRVVERTAAHIELHKILFVPQAQGRGLGTIALRTLQSEATDAGVPLRLAVRHANERALALYERLGFVRADVDAHHVRMTWCAEARDGTSP